MTLPRRTFLKLAALGTASLALPRHHAFGHSSGPIRESSIPVTPYVQPLPLPPILKPKKTKGVDIFTLFIKDGATQCHPEIPLPTDITGYASGFMDAPVFPGPMLIARRGKPSVIRVVNNLTPTGSAAKLLPALHLHGAVATAENTGHPNNTIPYNGGTRDYHFTNDQPAATLWYHDKSLHNGGQRLNAGLAGLYIITDPVESRLPLPKGKYDIPSSSRTASFSLTHHSTTIR